MKAPLTILGDQTAEPKGVVHPITLYEIGGLGGVYGLTLPRRDVQWTDVEPALPVTFRWVTGKEVAGEEQDGMIVRLSAHEAEIQSPTPPPPLTDLKLLLKPADGGFSIGNLRKGVRRPPRADSFVLRFTAVPQDARQYLDGLGRRLRAEKPGRSARLSRE